MSFLQFVWSKKWFDLNSSAAVVVTASVSAATVKMMNSPNLCITVLSLKCNYEDSRSFCHQIKSHIGWKDEVKTKQVITFSRPQTNWGGRVDHYSLTLVNFPPCDFDHFAPYFGQFPPLRLTLLPPVKWLPSPFSIVSKITILSVFHKLLRRKEL